ncbi:MAG: histidine kinase [Eubacteriales bacterium]|nr:histidine kinase [Eubacteriales bacterium]
MKKRNSLSIRVLAIAVIAALAFLALASFSVAKYLYQNERNSQIETELALMKKDADNVNYYLQELSSLCAAIFLDDKLCSNILFNRNSATAQDYIEGLLRLMTSGHNEIQQIYLYIPGNGYLYSIPRVLVSTIMINRKVENAEWYQQALYSEGLVSIGKVAPRIDFSLGTGQVKLDHVFTFNRVMRNVGGTVCQAIISLQIAPERLVSLLSVSNQNDVAILLKDGDTLYSSASALFSRLQMDAPEPMESYGYGEADGKKYLIFSQTIFNGLTIRRVIDMHTIEASVVHAVWINIVCMIGVSVILAGILVILLNREVIRPVVNVSDAISVMKNGERFPHIKYHRNDEIGRLADKFNEMSDSIDHLINSDFSNRLLAKNAQIVALRAQINPHFMNNLLQSIGNLALEKDNMDVYNAITVLADLMHYSYRADLQRVPLGTEIENLKNYIYLQQIRYGEKLQFSVSVAPALLKTEIPNLILQPLVENSIEHGLRSGTDQLSVVINIQMEEQTLTLIVRDNGTGMSTERLDKVRSWLRDAQTMESISEHVGISNVYLRLYLIFEDKMKFEIRSEEGVGTAIKIQIDMAKEAHEYVHRITGR